MHLKPVNVRRLAKADPKKIGLGDAVAILAQPVAKVVDAIAGTNLKNCLSCAERKANWNQSFPSINPLDLLK